MAIIGNFYPGEEYIVTDQYIQASLKGCLSWVALPIVFT